MTDTMEEFRRSPSLTAAGPFLVPPKPLSLQGRLTVVLDLDETLVYARQGPLYVRPGIEVLMRFLADCCETIVWTSSKHRYADAVVAQIDSCGAIQHTVYRHERWFNGSSATKDLKLLGRDLDSTVIIENTPDCCRGYEQNAVLVEDYEGGELIDRTLEMLVIFLKDMARRVAVEGISVSKYIASSPRVEQKEVLTDKGTAMKAYCLAPFEEQSSIACPPPSKYPGDVRGAIQNGSRKSFNTLRRGRQCIISPKRRYIQQKVIY